MYVQRDKNGNIKLLSRDSSPDCSEYLAPDSPEIALFLGKQVAYQEGDRLRKSDLEFVRVLEDVIELLMDKGVISFTELPEAAQQKVMERQTLRRRLNGLSLVGSDDEEGGVI